MPVAHPRPYPGKYPVADDDLVCLMGTLEALPLAESAFASPADRALYGLGAFAIEADDDRGERALVIIAEDRADAERYLRTVAEGECVACGGALVEGQLVVFTAGGDLEWNFHFACREDKRDHSPLW